MPPRRLDRDPSPFGSRPDERTNREPASDRRGHRQAACRRPALRDADRVRLPDREAARRGGHPGHPRRRLARHRPARLRQRDPRDDGRHAPPHGGRGARHEPCARGWRHAVPVVLDPDRSRRERRPLPPRGRRPGGQDRRRGPQRPHRRSARPGRDPGHGPHRLDAAGQARARRQGPRPGQDHRIGPGISSPTRWRSRRPARSPSSSSSSPSSWPARSPNGCASRRSGSVQARAAAARSRSSPTCWAGATGTRSTRSHTPTCARPSWMRRRRMPTRSPRARSPVRSRPSAWTTRRSTRCLVGARWTASRPPSRRAASRSTATCRPLPA